MVAIILLTQLLFLTSRSLQSAAFLHHFSDSTGREALGAVQAVISSQAQYACPMLLLLNNPTQITLQFLKEAVWVSARRGVTLFQVQAENVNNTVTQTHLREAVDNIRRLNQLWPCLALVLVSDDPTFLAAFAHMSFRRYALRWSTRILILTRLPLSELGGLHDLLCNRNAMLLRVLENNKIIREVGVYVASPYSSPTIVPRRVATWTPNTTWTRVSHRLFFPEKFLVFTSAPTLKVAVELLPYHKMWWVEDPSVPEGRRLEFTGSMDYTVKYFAQALNFTIRYVVSPERTFGSKLPDGSWTGMMGMVVREEAHFATGPFSLSPVRVGAADYTLPFWTGSLKIVGGIRGAKIDPWGFLLPLTFLVWVAILIALLGVLALLHLFPSCLPGTTPDRGIRSVNTLSSLRIILQQDIELPAKWRWWERILIGAWLLTTLVLTKSYSGNLMSILAVRYIPQPFQSIVDVLSDPRVGMIWQKYSRTEEFLRSAKSGVFREVANLEDEGRLKFHTQAQYLKSFNTLVRDGQYVLVDGENTIKRLMALDFSTRGRCDFYMSKDGFFPFLASVMSQKTNPIIQGINPRAMIAVESGLLMYWANEVPNFTRCDNVPKKVMLSTTFSITNLWGMFAVLCGGLASAMVVWFVELLVHPLKKHCLSRALPSISS